MYICDVSDANSLYFNSIDSPASRLKLKWARRCLGWSWTKLCVPNFRSVIDAIVLAPIFVLCGFEIWAGLRPCWQKIVHFFHIHSSTPRPHASKLKKNEDLCLFTLCFQFETSQSLATSKFHWRCRCGRKLANLHIRIVVLLLVVRFWRHLE